MMPPQGKSAAVIPQAVKSHHRAMPSAPSGSGGHFFRLPTDRTDAVDVIDDPFRDRR